MEMLAGLPYAPVEFGKDGSALPANDLGRIKNDLRSQAVTDLFVISHGWNNDKAEAHKLYERFFFAVKDAIDSNEAYQKRRYGIIGILWPSKKFADERQTPGGAAGASPDRLKATSSSVRETLADLKGVFSAHDADSHLEDIEALLSSVGDNQRAPREIMDHIREIMRATTTDPTAASQNEDNVGHFLTLDAGELLHMLGSPPRIDGARSHTAGTGGAADARPRGPSAAAGISFSGAWDAIRNGLNYATYYEMKNRAGIVGRNGVYATLRELRRADPDWSIHLIGHSFGARVVTAATDGPVGQGSPIRPESLTLAQAAFSHYGFAIRWDGAHDGLFRSVITPSKLAGPLLVTHSVNDKAVGVAYAIASRLANQVASAIGDEHDIYGGLGRNGALKCDARNATLGNPASYKWTPAAATNLNADMVIRDHSDIAKRELGEAILAAVLTT